MEYYTGPPSAKRRLQDFIQVARQYLSHGCLVVQLKLGQLTIDVADHRAHRVSIHGKTCFCPFMMDVVVAVHHSQLQKPFDYHGQTDRRDKAMAALRTTVSDCVQEHPIDPPVFSVGHCFSVSRRVHND